MKKKKRDVIYVYINMNMNIVYMYTESIYTYIVHMSQHAYIQNVHLPTDEHDKGIIRRRSRIDKTMKMKLMFEFAV